MWSWSASGPPRARPKSPMWALKLLSNKIFPLLISPWTILLPCKWQSPLAVWNAISFLWSLKKQKCYADTYIFFVSKYLLFCKHVPCECSRASWAFKPIRHGPVSHVLKNEEKVHYYVKKCNKQYGPGLKIIIVAEFPILGVMLVQLTFHHLISMLWSSYYWNLEHTTIISPKLL